MSKKRMGKPMTVNDTIESYRKRRNQLKPLLLGGLALLLVIIGIIIVSTLFAISTMFPRLFGGS